MGDVLKMDKKGKDMAQGGNYKERHVNTGYEWCNAIMAGIS